MARRKGRPQVVASMPQGSPLLHRLFDAVHEIETAIRSQLAATGRQDAPLGPMRATFLKSCVDKFLQMQERHQWSVGEIDEVRQIYENFPTEPALWDTLFFLGQLTRTLKAAAHQRPIRLTDPCLGPHQWARCPAAKRRRLPR